MVLLPVGVFALAKNWRKKHIVFVTIWFFTACLPAVLSRDQVHAVRSFNMVIPTVWILALGVEQFLDISKKSKKILIGISLVACYLVGVVYFLDALFIHVPEHASKLWEYGYKQVVEAVTPLEGEYEHIYIQQSYAQPYIYFLFFKN
jgi:hypothetical protein